MTAPKPLTRKLGPLPVWAWALVLVGVYLAYTHYSGTASASTSTPVTPNVGSAAQQPSSGQGSPTDNSSADLLSALDANSASYDRLLSALQYGPSALGGGGSGGGGVPPGYGPSTSAVTAPTVTDAGVTAATALPLNDAGVPMYSSYTTLGLPAPTADIGPAPQTDISSGASTASTTDALARYLANTTTASTFSAPVTAPTPTVVQPAPVDTGGVVVESKPGGARIAS